jgi:hypothetical protein
MTIKDRRSVKLRRLTYSELIEQQGLTKVGEVNRSGLSRYDRATLDAGPSVKHYSVESQISRNEKFAVRLIHAPRFRAEPDAAIDHAATGWEWPNGDKYRAAKARGHILKVVELKGNGFEENPYDVMDRLGFTKAERERIGEFHVTMTWS